MTVVTHQTIKLSKGKHRSPQEGACVMELASMLAGEQFSDHPRSVCPVIGSFLRAYNDAIDDERRQDLYAYAAKVVGSRSSAEVEHRREAHLTAWAAELTAHGRRSRWVRTMRVLRAITPTPPVTSIGAKTVVAAMNQKQLVHRNVLALIDELLALGASDPLAPSPLPGRASESSQKLGAYTP